MIFFFFFFTNTDFALQTNTKIIDCLFENNRAAGYGGAISTMISSSTGQLELTIDSCIFRNNSALQGGAIYASLKTRITNSTFDSNIAASGGDIYLSQSGYSEMTVIGSTFENGVAWISSGIYCGLGQMSIRESLFQNLNSVFFYCFNCWLIDVALFDSRYWFSLLVLQLSLFDTLLQCFDSSDDHQE